MEKLITQFTQISYTVYQFFHKTVKDVINIIEKQIQNVSDKTQDISVKKNTPP